MSDLPDYSNFIQAAYLIALSTLACFAIWSIFKFKINQKKLAKLENETKK